MNSISVFSSLLASMALIFMGLFILYKDWKDQVNRYFVLWSVSGLGILFSMFLTYYLPNSYHLTLFNKVSQGATVMTFASFMVMALVFPKGEKPYPLHRIILFLAPAIILSQVIIFTNFTIARAYFVKGTMERELHWGFYFYISVAFIYLGAGLSIFIRKYRRSTIRVHKLQMRLVFIGSGIALILASVASIIMPMALGNTSFYVVGPSIAVFFIASSLFYSVTSYNLMNIRTVIHRTMLYTASSFSIIVPILIVTVLYDLKEFHFDEVEAHLLAALVTVMFLIYAILVQPKLDIYFKRQQVEFDGIVNNFIKDVYNLQDFSKVIELTLEVLHKNLYLQKSVFWIKDEKGRFLKPMDSYGFKGDIEPIRVSSDLNLWFEKHREILQIERIYNDPQFKGYRERFAEYFNKNDLILMLPVYHDERLLGIMGLGSKQSLTAYSPEELERLNNFRLRSNDFISTAMTYKQAREDQFIARSVDLSGRIQANSLPNHLPNMNGIKFGSFLMPRYRVGNDYFDFLRPDNQSVGIFSTDVSGVGINSALYSVVLRSAAHSLLHETPSTHTFMQQINNVMVEYTGGMGSMVTGMYLFYDIRNMRLFYTNAGFPPIELFRVEKNDFDSLDTEGAPLGLTADNTYGIGRTSVSRGDIGVIYSKSLVTSKNRKGETFGLVRLRRMVNENRARRPVEISAQVQEQFQEFMGLSRSESDVTVLIFKFY